MNDQSDPAAGSWFLDSSPTAAVTDETDPATARVMGVELADDFGLAFGYLDDLFEPAADRINLATHGERFQHSTVMDDDVLADLNRSLGAMGTFPEPYDTAADLLAEYVARKYTLGRRVYDTVDRLADEIAECRDTLTRMKRQETKTETRAVMIPYGDHLLELGAFLYQRYETTDPSAVDDDRLPAFPNPQRADLVVSVLSAYDEVLPDAVDAGDRLTPLSGPLDTVADARLALSTAAVAVAYARWDASVDGSWPLPVGQFDVAFDEPSPETGMESLTEYTTEGIRIDSRAFDGRLAEVDGEFRDGTYLGQFRSLAGRYVRTARRVAGE
ncbi:hypothetical protein [Halobaculum sp. MBLA0143]|uniref:hypothetical protein n=1 Tax=Halobaculum sp. MBLA0143 TaxID=3079933 RepID=UPI003525832D